VDVIERARTTLLDDRGRISEADARELMAVPAERLPDLIALAHGVRLAYAGPEVEVESILSVKTGGCPEDCHFCSQSGRFETPVVPEPFLPLPVILEAARRSAKTGATEFCLVAAVRGPDERMMERAIEAAIAIREQIGIHVACSLGILTREQVEALRDAGVHRYNHNLETARSFFDRIVSTHTWEERHATCLLVKDAGMELCSGGIVGMGETWEQRVEFAAQLAALDPCEVPVNFLNPRPGTPLGERDVMDPFDALRCIALFRLMVPHATLRYAGGREITLGDLQSTGLLGGVNALIVGNYLTTLGRAPEADLRMLEDLRMPVKRLM
jgi:biotin synthase